MASILDGIDSRGASGGSYYVPVSSVREGRMKPSCQMSGVHRCCDGCGKCERGEATDDL